MISRFFRSFWKRVHIVDLSSKDVTLIEKIIEIRQKYRLKLPDAIIAATSIHNSAGLVTADKAFERVDLLTIIDW
ncbi:PIN domain-containing protein [Oscillatoria sp. CS-180]|uniref:PIN domain-containing protein n=1 Tax=Oscillatoria sp. CS-180 TaxID=3021720 RepID=UPI00232C2444|nr:PIN domain-containing protein [Oscillatoria sp. CS-180]MDB9526539.1 PIN domain-containing protein [Oscillatoria sp. CS-180]